PKLDHGHEAARTRRRMTGRLGRLPPADQRGEAAPEPLELGRVRIELLLARASVGEERANEHKPSHVEEKIVDLPADQGGAVAADVVIAEHHAASCTAASAS